MKKASIWSVPVCALAAGLALAVPRPAAASAATTVSRPMYAAFKDAALNGVRAVSARDVWAVGENANVTTLVAHWNGARWSRSSTGPGDFRGVASSSARDVWAVGAINESRTGGYAPQPLAEHWNGSSWTRVGTPHRSGAVSFRGVAVKSPRDAWAVGAINRTGPGVLASTPLIEHWNGKTWAVQRIPVPAHGGSLSAVAATSPSNAWAVGTAGGPVQGTLIEHWNGKTWKRVPSPNPPGSTTSSLNAVTAVSSGNVWAVGSAVINDLNQTLAMHWDGRHWTVTPSATPRVGGVLDGVAAAQASDIWAVGTSDVGYWQPRNYTLVEHWNSIRHRWTVVPSPGPPGTYPMVLSGVSAVSRDDVWAVGVNSNTTTLILHWNGKSWS